MARQDQRIEGGEAYQAGGDLTVTHGMDASQMAAIMMEMSKQLHVYFSDAQTKFEERVTDFTQKVLEEFSKPQNNANAESFRDPDFQFVLGDAQKVYVRDGEHELRDDLIRLLVQRSNVDSKERTAKILNIAIEISGSLSKNEYAALAITFLMRNVALTSKDGETIIRELNNCIEPFYRDLSDNETIYEYIESQRCGNINYLSESDIADILYQRYGNDVSYGFDPKTLLDISPKIGTEALAHLTVPAVAYRQIRFRQSEPGWLENSLLSLDLDQQAVADLIKLRDSNAPSKVNLSALLNDQIEGFSHIVQVWNSSSLSKINLTAVGKAIAHSSLASRAGFSAPLNIWVK